MGSRAQEQEIDSLKTVIANTADSVQIVALLKLCHLHLFTQPDTALELATRAYDKCVFKDREQEGIQVYKQLMAEAANRIGTAHYLLGDFGNALIQWENFLRINMQRGDNRGIALAYGNMGIAYRLQGNLVESLKSVMWALKLDRNLLL
ncbi:MAG: tetratricopeptide repeat protein, partial [Flavobacteriales bacterium]|nr:tetratricopeptide repeat protein [Flavobacteriales bacterium]